MSLLGGLLDIRPEERRTTFAAFGTLLAVTTGHTLLETTRDSLFLSKIPAAHLPWMYLVIVVIALALARMGSTRADSRGGVVSSLVAAAAVTAGFWVVLRHTGPGALYALYVWTGLFASWVTVQFWTLLGRLHTLPAAKRLYGVIGAGSVGGGVLGAFIARITMTAFPARTSLLISAALFLLAAVPCAMVRAPLAPAPVPQPTTFDADGDPGRPPMTAGMRLIWENGFARQVLAIALVSTITVTLADYLFKSRIAGEAHDAQTLGAFLSTFYAVTNSLSLVAQLVVAPWVFRTLGVQRALFFFPALMGLSAAGVVSSGGILASAVVLKGLDGVLRYSLHRTSSELLLVPVPDGVRERIKPTVDLLGLRGGQAVASLGILALVAVNLADAVTLGAVIMTLSVAWLALAVTIRRRYLDVFRETLRAGGLGSGIELPALDLNALETLFAGLNSSRDAEVLASLELLAEQHRELLIPALILYHPSSEVVLRALAIFQSMKRVDFVPIADRLNNHPDREVAAAALRARTAVVPDQRLLQERLEDSCAQVSVTALVALMARNWISREDARRRLEDIAQARSWQTAAELARAIRDVAGPRREGGAFEDLFDEMLIRIAQGVANMRSAGCAFEDPVPPPTTFSFEVVPPDVRVLTEVARAMEVRRNSSFLPVLVDMLSRHELRSTARSAIVKIPGALSFLDRSLVREDVPRGVRVHVPRTVAMFEPLRAVPILEAHLIGEHDGAVRFKVLRSLVRMRKSDPTIALDDIVLQEAVSMNLRHAIELQRWQRALTERAVLTPGGTNAAHHLLVDLTRDKEVHATQRLFLLLGLIYHEDFDDVWRGLRSSDPTRRASSLELVENIVEPPLRQDVLALIGDGVDADEPAASYEATLREIYEHDSETMRALAEYRAAELGIDIGQESAPRAPGSSALATSIGRKLVDRARGILVESVPPTVRGSRAPA